MINGGGWRGAAYVLTYEFSNLLPRLLSSLCNFGSSSLGSHGYSRILCPLWSRNNYDGRDLDSKKIREILFE